MEYIHHYNSPLGRMTMASAGSGLTGLWFDGQKYFGSTIGQGGVSGDLPVFDETERWLDLYFSGQAPDFTPPLAVFTEDVPKHRQAASGDMKAAPAYRQPARTAFDTPLAGWATPFRQAVWKARFARSKSQDEAIRSGGKDPAAVPVPDLLIRLYLGNENNTWKVYSIIFN